MRISQLIHEDISPSLVTDRWERRIRISSKLPEVVVCVTGDDEGQMTRQAIAWIKK